MPQVWSPSAEKLEKTSVFSLRCGEKTTTYYDRAFIYTPAIIKG